MFHAQEMSLVVVKQNFLQILSQKCRVSQLMVGILEVIAREGDRLKKITWVQKFLFDYIVGM